MFTPNRSLDRNKRVVRIFVFLFRSSPPLFRHLAAVSVSTKPAMPSTRALQAARNKDEAERKSDDQLGLSEGSVEAEAVWNPASLETKRKK